MRQKTLGKPVFYGNGLIMNNHENIQRLPDSVTLYYNIIIDPKTDLPYQVVQTSNNSKDYIYRH